MQAERFSLWWNWKPKSPFSTSADVFCFFQGLVLGKYQHPDGWQEFNQRSAWRTHHETNRKQNSECGDRFYPYHCISFPPFTSINFKVSWKLARILEIMLTLFLTLKKNPTEIDHTANTVLEKCISDKTAFLCGSKVDFYFPLIHVASAGQGVRRAVHSGQDRPFDPRVTHRCTGTTTKNTHTHTLDWAAGVHWEQIQTLCTETMTGCCNLVRNLHVLSVHV